MYVTKSRTRNQKVIPFSPSMCLLFFLVSAGASSAIISMNRETLICQRYNLENNHTVGSDNQLNTQFY